VRFRGIYEGGKGSGAGKLRERLILPAQLCDRLRVFTALCI